MSTAHVYSLCCHLKLLISMVWGTTGEHVEEWGQFCCLRVCGYPWPVLLPWPMMSVAHVSTRDDVGSAN